MIEKLKSYIKHRLATISYILGIILVNSMFTHLPVINFHGCVFSPADITVGIIYVLRDFAQREIAHRVILAMLVGAVISYGMADKIVAVASVSGFFVGEVIDWLIFTFTKRPLSERILWSSCLSVPLDSFVFLALIQRLSVVEFTLITLAKFIGIFAIWAYWKKKSQAPAGLVACRTT